MDESIKSIIPYFWDDNHVSSNGFIALTEYVNKILEVISTFISLVESRVSAEDNFGKIIGKITRGLGKIDLTKSEYVVKVVSDIYIQESIIRQHLCEEIIQDCVEPMKETFKKQFEIIKQTKSDCNISLKNRKNQYEIAIKAVKAYTSKYRAHEQLVKKNIGQNTDEKIKMKILKNQQAVKLAEKDAKVSIEMLNQDLFEYKEAYILFCTNIEKLNKTLVESAQKTLEKLYSTCCAFTLDLNNVYSKLISTPLESNYQTYIDKFVAEKGAKKVYLGHATLMEEGEGDNISHTVQLWPSPEDVTFTKPRPSSLTISNSKDPLNNDIESPRIPSPVLSAEENSSKDETLAVYALYDFLAQNEDELSFSKGDKIEIVSKEDESWYIGRLENGKTGVFPIAYASQPK